MEIKGNFANYAISASGNFFVDDEDAVIQACDLMFSMCGNAGQEAMIGDNLEWFFDWAIHVLEDPTARGTYYEDFAQMVFEEVYGGRVDKWLGTEDIWAEGWMHVAEQSGYHDSRDEQGEGTGVVFS